MVALASVGKLVESLAELKDEKASHVWLDDVHGLVVGRYPDPTLCFDFAAERMIPVILEASTTHLPKTAKPVESLLYKAGRIRSVSRIETPEAIYEVGSATQMLVEGLNIVERMRPGTIEKFALEKGITKRPVATSHRELYDVPHPSEHSTKLDNGYYVATNNKAYEAVRFLRRAIQIAGLGREITLHTA